MSVSQRVEILYALPVSHVIRNSEIRIILRFGHCSDGTVRISEVLLYFCSYLSSQMNIQLINGTTNTWTFGSGRIHCPGSVCFCCSCFAFLRSWLFFFCFFLFPVSYYWNVSMIQCYFPFIIFPFLDPSRGMSSSPYQISTL